MSSLLAWARALLELLFRRRPAKRPHRAPPPPPPPLSEADLEELEQAEFRQYRRFAEVVITAYPPDEGGRR